MGQERGGEINAFQPGESQAGEGVQAVAAAAEEFDDFRVARPIARAGPFEAAEELADFLLGGFEAEIGCFPLPLAFGGESGDA